MTTQRKLIAWTVLILLAIPGFVMLFNENTENIHINLLGFAYCYGMVKLAPHILPDWLTRYYRSLGE